MGITYGDHLIDSGYYDITPEQEKEVEKASVLSITSAALSEAIAVLRRLVVSAPDIGVDEFREALNDARALIAKADGTELATGAFVEPRGREPCSSCRNMGECDGSCTHPAPPADDIIF